METKRACERFIAFKSLNTQRRYETILAQLREYLAGQSIGSVTPNKALDYIRHLKDQGKSDATISNTIALLSALYRHLSDLDLIRGNPWALARIAIPARRHVQVRPTKLVPLELVPEILDLPDPRTKIGVRDRAILAVMFGGGLRRSEVVGLDMRDVLISADGSRLIIRESKAGKRQEQALPEWAAERLAELVAQRSGDGATPIGPLFPTYDLRGRERGRMSAASLRRLYSYYLEQVGLEGYAPHSARATAATALLQSGATDREVRDFLRHRTTGMVEVYDKRAAANDEIASRLTYGND